MSESLIARTAWFETTKYFRRLALIDQNVQNGTISAEKANDILFCGKHYFLEVDIEYPVDIQNRDDDYPFSLEIIEFTANMHSEYHLKFIN